MTLSRNWLFRILVCEVNFDWDNMREDCTCFRITIEAEFSTIDCMDRLVRIVFCSLKTYRLFEWFFGDVQPRYYMFWFPQMSKLSEEILSSARF